MADGDEDAVRRDLAHDAGLGAPQPDAGHAERLGGPDDLVDGVVPDHVDIAHLEQAVLQDALGLESVAAMDDRHVLGELAEIESLLDGGIAAADDDHVLAAIEETVAGGAGRDAVALERLLRGDAEPFGPGAGRDHERIGGIERATVAFQHERASRQIGLDDMVGDHDRADMLGLGAHLLHQPGTLDRRGEARIVLDVGGDHQLAAWLETRDQHRFQHRAGGVDGGRVAGRAGADDDHRRVSGRNNLGHGLSGSTLLG